MWENFLIINKRAYSFIGHLRVEENNQFLVHLLHVRLLHHPANSCFSDGYRRCTANLYSPFKISTLCKFEYKCSTVKSTVHSDEGSHTLACINHSSIHCGSKWGLWMFLKSCKIMSLVFKPLLGYLCM